MLVLVLVMVLMVMVQVVVEVVADSDLRHQHTEHKFHHGEHKVQMEHMIHGEDTVATVEDRAGRQER